MTRFRLVWCLIVVLLIGFLLARYERFAIKRGFGDFHVYYVTGERVLAAKSIYVDDTSVVTPFKYSPLVASFFALLAIFPEPVAAGVWFLFNLGCLAGSGWLALRIAEQGNGAGRQTAGSGKQHWMLAALAALGISPVLFHCLDSGQVGFAILLSLMLGIHFTGKRQEGRAALFFALSCMFKYLPVLLVPYWMVRKKWRLVFLFGFWFVGLHVIPAAWFGWQTNGAYLKEFLPFLTGTTLDHISLLDFKNQSIWAYLYRLLFYDFGFMEIRNRPDVLLSAGCGFFGAFYAIIAFRRSQSVLSTEPADYAGLMMLILLFNPNAWSHNFVLLFWPYFLLLLEASKHHWKHPLTALLALTSFLILLTNRSIVGWGLRFDLMSASVLMLAALLLFAAVLLYPRPAKSGF